MGGAQEVAISLSEALAPQINFTVFSVLNVQPTAVGQAYARRLAQVDIPVVLGTRVPMKAGGALPAGAALRRLTWATRPDVVHVHTEIPETTTAVALELGLPPGTRLLRTVHSSNLWPAWQRIGRWTEHRMRPAETVAVSRGALEGLWQFQDTCAIARTPPERCQQIYNGVRTLGVAPGRGPQQAHRPVRVLFAGRFEPEKGGDLVPDIVAAAAPMVGRPVSLTLAGHGSQEGLLRAWAERTQPSWQVHIRPSIPNLAEAFAQGDYDLLLMPSRFEGLALLALEALMAGLPVVAAAGVPGLSEVFPAGYPLLAQARTAPDLAVALAAAINEVEANQTRIRGYFGDMQARFGVQRMANDYRAVYFGRLAQASAVAR